METIDTNAWYSLLVASRPGSSYLSTDLYDEGVRGAVFFSPPTPDNEPAHLWQIVPHPANSSRYMFRTSKLGPNAFLALGAIGTVGTPPNQSANQPPSSWSDPIMIARQLVDDDRAFWCLESLNYGESYLSNALNGTALHLAEDGRGRTELLTNDKLTPPDNQRFFFEKSDKKIDSSIFSTINLQSTALSIQNPATSTSTTTSTTTTSTPIAAPTTTTLPSNTIIALSVSLSTAAFIALSALLYYLLIRRRRRSRTPPHENNVIPNQPGLPVTDPTYAYYYSPCDYPQEMPSSIITQKLQELDASAVELATGGQNNPAPKK